MTERTFTTHDIAKYCDVYPSSVQNWINNGKLKAYQTPGGHHRVTREDLLAFLRKLDIPVPPEVTGRTRVLIVDDDEGMCVMLKKAFSRFSDRFDVETCGDGVEALIRIGKNAPDLVVLDIILPKLDGFQVCRVLKSRPETADVKVVAISGKKKPDGICMDAYVRKPFDAMALVERCAELAGVPAGVPAKGRTRP